jgi:hypothetical protein
MFDLEDACWARESQRKLQILLNWQRVSGSNQRKPESWEVTQRISRTRVSKPSHEVRYLAGRAIAGWASLKIQFHYKNTKSRKSDES